MSKDTSGFDRKPVDSFGAVVWEEKDGIWYVLMIDSGKGLSFPKGRIEPGETGPEAAAREVLEETGIRIQIDPSFAQVVPCARAREGSERKVTFYGGKSLEGLKGPQACDEVAGAFWVPADKAAQGMFFPADKNVLFQSMEYYGVS